jgi:hypothetical protein
MEDSVLQRPMFNAPQQPDSVAPTTGIATVRSPRDTANELRNMFAPTVPVQSFQEGGIVQPAAPEPATGIADLLRGSRGNPLLSIGRMDFSGMGGAAGGALTGLRDRFLASRGVQTPVTFPENIPEPPRRPVDVPELPAPTEVGAAPGMNFPEQPPAAAGTPASAPAPAAERPKGEVQLTLEGIKADRARLAEDKKQNAMLALMQAGLAMAAGRSPSAISNIAAGGQAGIAAFAGMERDRRAEDAALRREQTGLLLEQQRMRAQEERAPEAIRNYAYLGGFDPAKGREGFDEAVRRGIEVSKSLEREPDTMRLIKALGGGDLARGFEIYKGDESLKAAQATVGNYAASEEDRRRAQSYLNARIQQSLQSLQRGQGGQGGQTPPPGSTVIPFNQLPR